MRTLWAMLLGGLALIGTADARLGETIEEIEKRVGKLHILTDLGDMDETIVGIASSKAGFGRIDYVFFKSDPAPRKCVMIQFFKRFDSLKDIDITPKDVDDLVRRNFPDQREAMPGSANFIDITESRGFGLVVKDGEISPKIGEAFDPLIPTSPLWFVSWGNIRGDTATAGISRIDNSTLKIDIHINSERYNAWWREGLKKAKEEKEKNKKSEWDAL